MKHKISAVIMTLAMAAVCMTGCLDSDKKGSTDQNDQNTAAATEAAEPVTDENGEEMSESMELMRIKFKDVPEIESGPLIKMSNTEAKPGEIAKVTVSVTGADKKWSMCGIHITYPDVLECQLDDEEELIAEYELGKATEHNSGFVAMDWQRNLDPELTREHKRSVFFTTMFQDNNGKDGDIATFFFKVPNDAQPGTVYELGYYYMDSDMFRDLDANMSFEKYAFEHLEGGSITVR
ncbi:cohesin domain-containing protein [Ruminococcus flavefaciens]|uniref:cohesin domain-containing protein n=1 Tax=Ruminococcus flavefaciens TaxID=1265 RepID=UPI00048B735B|nr:cohesin domain-containing protein [Ruminococcus flavefaciens]